MAEDDVLNELKNISQELKDIKKEIEKLNENLTSLSQPPTFTIKNVPDTFEKGKIDFKACIDTLDAIKKWENEYQRGVTAQELASYRDLSRPTIYSHLEELEKGALVFTLRGSTIGLKPANSNFYYAKEREPTKTIFNFATLTSLESDTQKVASIIKNSGEKGITKEELFNKLNIESTRVKKELKKLLKQGLITYYLADSQHRYYGTGLE